MKKEDGDFNEAYESCQRDGAYPVMLKTEKDVDDIRYFVQPNTTATGMSLSTYCFHI